MSKLKNIIRDARVELDKVIFPVKEQVKNAFFSVFVVVTVITLFLALIDGVMSFTLSTIMG